MAIPTITPYGGGVANPDGSQTQTEFTQNMFDQLSYEAQLASELNATVNATNTTALDVSSNASVAQNSADTAQAAANFEGDFTVGVTSAVKGKSYSYNGNVWLCLQNTTAIPSTGNAAWKISVGEQYVTTAQSDVLGGKLFKGSNGENVEVGDQIPSGTTHLRISVGGNQFLVKAWDSLTLPATVTTLPLSDNGFNGYHVVTDQGTFEFVTLETYNQRGEFKAVGWGYKNDYYLYTLNPVATSLGSTWSAIKNPNRTDNSIILKKLVDEAIRTDARDRLGTSTEQYGITRTQETTVIKVPRKAAYFEEPVYINNINNLKIKCDEGVATFVGKKGRVDEGLTADEDFILLIGTEGRNGNRAYGTILENIIFTYEGANILENDFDAVAHGDWYDGSLHFDKCGGGVWVQEGHYTQMKNCKTTGTRCGLRGFGSWLFKAEDCDWQYNEYHVYSTEDAVTVPSVSAVQILQRFRDCSFTNGIVNGSVFFNSNSSCIFESSDFEANMGCAVFMKFCVNLTFINCHEEINGYYKVVDPSKTNWNNSHPSNPFGSSVYEKGSIVDALSDAYQDVYYVTDRSRRIQLIDGGTFLSGDILYQEIGFKHDTVVERKYISGTVKAGQEIFELYSENTQDYGDITLTNVRNDSDGQFVSVFGCSIYGDSRPADPKEISIDLNTEPKGMKAVTCSTPKSTPGTIILNVSGTISDRDYSQMDCGMISGGNMLIRKDPDATSNPAFSTYASIAPPKGGMVTFEDIDFYSVEMANPRLSSTDLVRYFRGATGVVHFVRCKFGKDIPVTGTDDGVFRIYNSGELVLIFEDCVFNGDKNTNSLIYQGLDLGRITVYLKNTPINTPQIGQRDIALGMTGKVILDANSTGWTDGDNAEYIAYT